MSHVGYALACPTGESPAGSISLAAIIPHRIRARLHARRISDTPRLHAEPRNLVILHDDVARRLRPEKPATQIDAGLQCVGLVLWVIASGLRSFFIAVRQVDVQKPIVRDGVPRAER